MNPHQQLLREIATLCLSMNLVSATDFVDRIDPAQLTPTEYIAVLSAAAGRIAGCAAYAPADASVVAAQLTHRALQAYDPTDGDQTIDTIKLVSRYLRYGPADFRSDGVIAGLTRILGIWIDVWTAAESAVDPTWKATDVFPAFDPGPSQMIIEGQSPNSIADPSIRQAYIEHLERKWAFQRRARSQVLLRRALEETREGYLGYVAELRSIEGLVPALAANAQRVTDPDLRQALASPSPPSM